ncbi:MAG: c-type cytochrome biogenesis protein CcsB [Aquificaceae bacterium]
MRAIQAQRVPAIWVIFLLGPVFALTGADNVFWYKSAMALYALSALLFVVSAVFREKLLESVAFMSLYFGLGLNLAGMIRRGIQTFEMGAFHPPWSNLFEALTFWSFATGMIFLFLHQKYRINALGAFIVPIVFGFSAFAISYASSEITPLVPALRSYWLYFHVITAFTGYAGFTLAFGGALLLLFKKRYPSLALPSQEVLDSFTYKAVVIVFPIWTASIMLGSIWANEAWGGYWSWDPKEVWSLIVWLFFGAYLHLRQILGWRGARSAWVVVFGFVSVLICFFAVNLFFPGLHSYATD